MLLRPQLAKIPSRGSLFRNSIAKTSHSISVARKAGDEVSNIFRHQNRALAYVRTPGSSPGVVFLGGFRSDMEGTKARCLELWAKREGRAFLRFDYSGHGASSGEFSELGIDDWAADTAAIISGLTEGPQILVGSSMGGWISLLLARAIPESVLGLVTIAAAPDFTEDKLWAGFDESQKSTLEAKGVVEVPSAYDEAPYPISRRLIEQGRQNLVLQKLLSLPFPVRILHGTNDTDVDISVAYRLLDHAKCEDMRLIAVKGADHRFSDPECLKLIIQAIEEVIARSDR